MEYDVAINNKLPAEECASNINIEPESEKIGLVKRSVNFMGNAMTLIGPEMQLGAKAPDFHTLGLDLLPMKFLRTYKGAVSVIATFQSLDLEICSKAAKAFEKAAEKLGPNVNFVIITMDLPFAQKRWAKDNRIKNIHLYSDYYRGEFGKAWGVYVREQHLLAPAVFVTDIEARFAYVNIQPEMTNEPDYKTMLSVVKKLFSSAKKAK